MMRFADADSQDTYTKGAMMLTATPWQLNRPYELIWQLKFVMLL